MTSFSLSSVNTMATILLYPSIYFHLSDFSEESLASVSSRSEMKSYMTSSLYEIYINHFLPLKLALIELLFSLSFCSGLSSL